MQNALMTLQLGACGTSEPDGGVSGLGTSPQLNLPRTAPILQQLEIGRVLVSFQTKCRGV